MATEIKRYEVVAGPNAKRPKGMWMFEPDGEELPNGQPTGKNVLVPVGKTVELTEAAAKPLVDIGRLRPVATRGRKPASAEA